MDSRYSRVAISLLAAVGLAGGLCSWQAVLAREGPSWETPGDTLPIPAVRFKWPAVQSLVARVNVDAERLVDQDTFDRHFSEHEVLFTDVTGDAEGPEAYEVAVGVLDRQPGLLYGTYLNPRAARKIEHWRKSPAEALAYEMFPEDFFVDDYEEGVNADGQPIDRAWFDISDPKVVNTVVAFYAHEARMRPGDLVMLDNCSSGKLPWEVRVQYLQRISRALETADKLTIGNFGSFYDLIERDYKTPTNLHLKARDIEGALHGVMIEQAFPTAASRADMAYVRAVVDTLRHLLARRMCVVLLTLGDAHIGQEYAYLAVLVRDARHPCLYVSHGSANPPWLTLPALLGSPLEPEPRLGKDAVLGPYLKRRFELLTLTFYLTSGKARFDP